MPHDITPQFYILTSMKSCISSNNEVVVNPFYGATHSKVLDNFDRAKDVYGNVFKAFIAAWLVHGDRSNIPPSSWQILEI